MWDKSGNWIRDAINLNYYNYRPKSASLNRGSVNQSCNKRALSSSSSSLHQSDGHQLLAIVYLNLQLWFRYQFHSIDIVLPAATLVVQIHFQWNKPYSNKSVPLLRRQRPQQLKTKSKYKCKRKASSAARNYTNWRCFYDCPSALISNIKSMAVPTMRQKNEDDGLWWWV